MYKSILMLACLFILTGVLTNDAHAQYREWREYSERTYEGGDIDEDDIRSWRTRNTELQRKIDRLDDDVVEDLHVPVLLGVSLSDITPNFGDPRGGGTREHEGLDMLAPDGAPIVSPTEAVVIRVGDGDSSGKYVSTANPGGETFVYMHLADIADIEEGDELDAGDPIGFVGNTGNASGGLAHLHFEIRDGREALDPFDRLTKVFSLEEQMDTLNAILKVHVEDQDKYAEFLVEEYLGFFIQARAADIEIPWVVTEVLPESVRNNPSGIPAQDLSLGDSGPAVVALQSVLIAQGYLDLSSPTDQFGPLTEAALIAYQKAEGISPASGYYGPLTRAHMGGSTVNPDREALLAKIVELTALVAQLQALLDAQNGN